MKTKLDGLIAILSCALLAFMVGCGGKKEEEAAAPPRPVEVMTLSSQSDFGQKIITGSVGSWKTEQIAFEVNGRIKRVIEPNEDVVGKIPKILGTDGQELPLQIAEFDIEKFLKLEPTLIAEVDSERYQLAFESAKLKKTQTEKALEAAQIELKESIPKQVDAAEADKELAQIEYDRAVRLAKDKAGAKADVNRANAKLKTVIAQLAQLEAAKRAKQAEISSLEAQVEQAEQSVKDAKRNLDDCELYSSFPGQIADVHVVPGSVVGPGEPVATVQMMNPIKIEFEVSAEESRRLQRRQQLPVFDSNGIEFDDPGYLYLIDPVADPQTRTFTATLLIMNKKKDSVFANAASEGDALTDQIWRLDFDFLPGSELGIHFVPEDAIQKEEDGSFYVWKIENVHVRDKDGMQGRNDRIPEDHGLVVTKAKVKPELVRVPFLGNFVFQQITFDKNQLDPEKDLICGRLRNKEGEPLTDWSGTKVILDRGKEWGLRPGDLVRVDISERTDSVAEEFFVPMDAIAHMPDGNFVFVVNSGESTVSKVKVDVIDQSEDEKTSSIRKIKSASNENLTGKKIVIRGAHYLRDKEPVRIVDSEDRK